MLYLIMIGFFLNCNQRNHHLLIIYITSTMIIISIYTIQRFRYHCGTVHILDICLLLRHFVFRIEASAKRE